MGVKRVSGMFNLISNFRFFNWIRSSGTNWSAGGALSAANYFSAQAGTQTQSLAFGGETPGGNSALTEEYNGTAWTEKGDLNQL